MAAQLTSPKRIQRKRSKSWKMPSNTVYVGRPSKWGNPFIPSECREACFIGTDRQIILRCVEAFRTWLLTPFWRENWDGQESENARNAMLSGLPELPGKNLACWCPTCDRHKDGKPFDEDCPDCQPCHADVLGREANK